MVEDEGEIWAIIVASRLLIYVFELPKEKEMQIISELLSEKQERKNVKFYFACWDGLTRILFEKGFNINYEPVYSINVLPENYEDEMDYVKKRTNIDFI